MGMRTRWTYWFGHFPVLGAIFALVGLEGCNCENLVLNGPDTQIQKRSYGLRYPADFKRPAAPDHLRRCITFTPESNFLDMGRGYLARKGVENVFICHCRTRNEDVIVLDDLVFCWCYCHAGTHGESGFVVNEIQMCRVCVNNSYGTGSYICNHVVSGRHLIKNVMKKFSR